MLYFTNFLASGSKKKKMNSILVIYFGMKKFICWLYVGALMMMQRFFVRNIKIIPFGFHDSVVLKNKKCYLLSHHFFFFFTNIDVIKLIYISIA